MSLRPLYALMLLGSLAELGACKALLKKKDPDPAPSAAAIVAPPTVIAPVVPELATSAPVPTLPVLDEASVATSEDFEDEAFEKVTPANFKAEFATLKTAISK